MKRKMELDNNFFSPEMLQSVACLTFSVFEGGLKIEIGKNKKVAHEA